MKYPALLVLTLLSSVLLISSRPSGAQGAIIPEQFGGFRGNSFGGNGFGEGIRNDGLTAYAPDPSVITNGVKEIVAPGVPGIVATTSQWAFPVVAGRVGKNGRESVVAAVERGKTRIVAFGHDGYLNPETLAIADTGKLMDNALAWVSRGEKPAKVGVLADAAVLESFRARGYNVAPVQNGNFEAFSTLIINGHSLQKSDFQPLVRFLFKGGGLVIATTGWGWAWGDDSQELARDFVGNQAISPYGLVWTMGTVEKTTANGFKVEPVPPLANAARAYSALQNDNFKPEDGSEISSVLGNALTGLADYDQVLLPKLKSLTSGAKGDVVPFDRHPIKTDNPTARVLLTLQTALAKQLPASEVKPHPAGAIFPGDVPPNARPVTKTASVNTAIPEWHSLGLYAAPGIPISVTLLNGVKPDGLSIRIGCHTDTLYNLDSWKRAPDISRVWPLQAGTTQVANPFGGLVYVVVPSNAAPRKVDVSIGGAYAAPLFEQGKTDLNEWRNTQRWLPGPWAEIATDHIVLTVPSRSVRDLDDPTQVCDLYNRALDAMADLRGLPRARKRPERIVCDEQISAGYMHSGYPVMTWMDMEKKTVDYNALVKESWGHWHELGHNHQRDDWTFEGTGEVTNNLYALYVWETVIGGKQDAAHPALTQASFAKEWAKYDAGGRKFSNWQSNPFLALHMYLQVQNAFGWEPFKKVFHEYEVLPDAQRPKTDDAKRDQWLVRFSRAVGRNLGPFYQVWGVPTSQDARDQIKDLPPWMPTFPATQSNGLRSDWHVGPVF